MLGREERDIFETEGLEDILLAVVVQAEASGALEGNASPVYVDLREWRVVSTRKY
jgi:hypothetical protein